MNRKDTIKAIEEFKTVFKLFDTSDEYIIYGRVIDLRKEKYSEVSRLVKAMYRSCNRAASNIGKEHIVIPPRLNIIGNRFLLFQLISRKNNLKTEVKKNEDKKPSKKM